MEGSHRERAVAPPAQEVATPARAPLAPHRVLALQRTAGNQATQRVLQRILTFHAQPVTPNDDFLTRFMRSLARDATVPKKLVDALREAAADEKPRGELEAFLQTAGVVAPNLSEAVDRAYVAARVGGAVDTIAAINEALKLGYKGKWYPRDEFNKIVIAEMPGDYWTEEQMGFLKELPAGSSYKAFFEVSNALTQIRHRPKPVEPKPPTASVTKPPEEKPPEQPKRAPVTPLTASLGDAEAYEREIGQRALASGISLKVAQAMSAKVVDFIEAFHKATNGARNLYAEIGTESRHSAGAVGKNPDTVKAALTDPDGSPHEKLTQVLNFKNVFESLCVEPQTRSIAPKIADQLGFDRKFMGDEAHKALAAVKDEKDRTVKPSSNLDFMNKRSASELGIKFSQRERDRWQTDLPEFEVGSTKVEVDPESQFAKENQALGFPVKSGPSTHTFEIFEMHDLLGLQGELTLDEIMLAATGYLLPIGAHSLIEIQHVAEQFGLAPVKSPELYGRLLVALRRTAKLTEKTAQSMRDELSTDFDKIDQAALAKAHHKLLSAGYVFLAYHGSNKKAARSIHAKGFDEKYESRKDDDPWRGVYVTPDINVAKGYLTPKVTSKVKPEDPEEAQTMLLRVYVPGELVQACIQARLPLDDQKALAEIGRRLSTGTLAPPHGDHMIIGRERSHADNAEEANSLEAVVSWSIAAQCIALPSLHSEKGLSEFELGLPQQVTMPQELSFEQGEGSQGGLDLRAPTEQEDVAAWSPSGATADFKGEWNASGYATDSPEGGPSRSEAEILRRLGFTVPFGASWKLVAEQSLQRQVNAFTLVEMLPQLKEIPPQSPIWSDFMHRLGSADEHSLIQPGLYLSGWKAAVDHKWQQAHVKSVLNCCQYSFPQAEGIKYQHVNVTGYSNGMFEWASRQIVEQAKNGVLVHCVEGKNRSATLLTAHLMKAYDWNALQAARFVTARRPWAEPDLEALADWEDHLIQLGSLPPRQETKASASTQNEKDEWLGTEIAIRESLRTLEAHVLFESAGTAVGLHRFMTLHNASGEYNNCLIYSIAGALGVNLSSEKAKEYGDSIRKSRVGVERNGFLNAQAVPAILAFLGAAGRRLVIVDTSGKVEAPETGGVDTYSAEVVNATGANTIVIVNQGNVHFGYGQAINGNQANALNPGDGNQWIQFTGPAQQSALGPQNTKPGELVLL